MDDEMKSMVDSITQHGVLAPGLVRPIDSGGYEMVSGHRKKAASKEAGLHTSRTPTRAAAS